MTDVKKLFHYWAEEADYSWSVAKSLLEKKKYAEALFFGHLTVEKALKALVVAKTKKHAPPIHNLLELIKKTELVYTGEQVSELKEFNGYYMAGRYDEEKMEFRQKCTPSFTKSNLHKMEKYYLWLKEEIKNKSRSL